MGLISSVAIEHTCKDILSKMEELEKQFSRGQTVYAWNTLKDYIQAKLDAAPFE